MEQAMAHFSDLEYVVLGIVWKFGPCTAYAVRKEFLTSPSSHFSGSAGAIYPLMQRLENQGLISSSSGSHGKRARCLYAIEPKGSKVLRRWLSLPLPERSSVATYNPLRARFYFLKALSSKQQESFLDNATILVNEEIALVSELSDGYLKRGDLFSYLATRSSYLALTSQLAWLHEVKSKIHELGK